MHTVAFTPSGKSIAVEHGSSLLDACRSAGFPIPTPCGNNGQCGKCRVRILSGNVPVTPQQQHCLPPSALNAGYRAACIAAVTADLVINDPDTETNNAVLVDFATRTPARLDGEPNNAIKANTPAPHLGLAVDLGTTTIAVALCDLDTGGVLAVTGGANPQSLHGDDVVSRIDYAGGSVKNLEEMQRLAIDAIYSLAEESRRLANVAADILLLAVGGNTVMNHLLLGVDPASLAVSPFTPCFQGLPPVSAADIGWKNNDATLLIVPNIAAYVGGDVTAGMLAHDVAELPGATLFVDVGTNGEIVLAVDGRVYACAAAAGPAFEGARISQGMRAMPGAIGRVDIEHGVLTAAAVGDAFPAKGVCGTGLLDAVAALLRAGVIDEGGYMPTRAEAEKLDLPPDILSRLHENDDGAAFWLETPAAHGGPGVALTQRDVREFQLAKGAMAAGVTVLLRAAGIRAENIDRVFLAGGFGSRLRPASAIAVGLLPEGVDEKRVTPVGNASLAGTRLCLLSEDERTRADKLAARVEYVELSGREDFQQAFAEEMLFPEP